MAMSLTKDDLQAVKQLVDSSIDERVPAIIDERVQPMLDKLEDRTFKRLSRLEHRLNERIDETNEILARKTAAGFEEVHHKIDEAHDKIDNLSVQVHDIGQAVERIEQSRCHEDKRDKLRTIK